MSANRIIPVVLLGILAPAALIYWLGGKKNQTFDGVIVMNVMTYEFYPNAQNCDYRGMPYVLLPSARFDKIVTTRSADIKHALHGTWRAKLNDLSPVGWHKYRKTYWRELSVNYVVDAIPINCH